MRSSTSASVHWPRQDHQHRAIRSHLAGSGRSGGKVAPAWEEDEARGREQKSGRSQAPDHRPQPPTGLQRLGGLAISEQPVFVGQDPVRHVADLARQPGKLAGGRPERPPALRPGSFALRPSLLTMR